MNFTYILLDPLGGQFEYWQTLREIQETNKKHINLIIILHFHSCLCDIYYIKSGTTHFQFPICFLPSQSSK